MRGVLGLLLALAGAWVMYTTLSGQSLLPSLPGGSPPSPNIGGGGGSSVKSQ
jgi:hypothetical protein